MYCSFSDGRRNRLTPRLLKYIAFQIMILLLDH